LIKPGKWNLVPIGFPMATSSLSLVQLGLLEEQVRRKADAAMEESRDLVAEHRISAVCGSRRPCWQTAVKTLNIAIDLVEVERRQANLLALLTLHLCKSLGPEESRSAAAKVNESVQSLNQLLQVAQNGPPLAYHLWKNRLFAIQDMTEKIDYIADSLRTGSDALATGGFFDNAEHADL
jgi:hypothetical protein